MRYAATGKIPCGGEGGYRFVPWTLRLAIDRACRDGRRRENESRPVEIPSERRTRAASRSHGAFLRLIVRKLFSFLRQKSVAMSRRYM